MVSIDISYQKLGDLIHLIDEPARFVCLKIWQDHQELFEKTRGSTHNHQIWDGGYIDHITDGLNYARCLYQLDASFGRPMPFSISDALLIFYLHDLEKPWRFLVTEDGTSNKPGLDTKQAFKEFREQKLAEYGLVLTDYQLNGLTYVEGELADYSSTRRVMNELAAFCHKVDVWSARQCYDYPKINDEWPGAGRFGTYR